MCYNKFTFTQTVTLTRNLLKFQALDTFIYVFMLTNNNTSRLVFGHLVITVNPHQQTWDPYGLQIHICITSLFYVIVSLPV